MLANLTGFLRIKNLIMEIFIKILQIHECMDEESHEPRKNNWFLNVYDKQYKSLLIISLLLLVFSVGVIAHSYITTGQIVERGVTLTGGISFDLTSTTAINSDALQKTLLTQFPDADINVRSFGEFSGAKGYSIEAAGVEDEAFIDALAVQFPDISRADILKAKNTVGPSFGSSIYIQALKSVFIAFFLMSLVIFLYFGESTKMKWIAFVITIVASLMMFYANSIFMYVVPALLFFVLLGIYIHDSIPSFGIVFCAFSDVLFSLAIFTLSGLKLNVWGIVAFLMLVGYSIDTDILLSVRVLKRKGGTMFSRIVDALKTGVTMSVCALVAVLAALFFSHSLVIKEIMFILTVGLIGDIIFTWIQNAGILRWHLEKKGWK